MAYSITWEEYGSWIRYSDVVTDESLLLSMQEVLDHAHFPTLRYFVLLPADADLSQITAGAARQVAALHTQGSDLNPNIMVIVGYDSVLARGLTAMYYNWYRAMGGRWSVEIVDTEAAARARVAELLSTSMEH